MAPKQKITKDEIESGAYEFVRENGIASMKARSLSAYLHCSTQPIFSNFAGMDEVRSCVIRRALACCEQYLTASKEGDGITAFTSMAKGYLRFANEEKNLFRMLFLESRPEVEKMTEAASIPEVRSVLRMIAGGEEQDPDYRFRLELWFFAHGIASLLSNGYVYWEDMPIEEILNEVYLSLASKKHPAD